MIIHYALWCDQTDFWFKFDIRALNQIQGVIIEQLKEALRN